MSSRIGKMIQINVFGESHGKAIGLTIEGLPSGVTLDFERIDLNLSRRRGIKELSTSRQEKDEYQIVSGYFNNKTTGTPLTFIIENKDVDDKVYDDIKDIVRPGHADYVSYLKYQGYQDYRGGGHFSGRLTTPLVIAGSIALQLLETKGIKVGSRIKQIYDVFDEDIDYRKVPSLIDEFNLQEFPTISSERKQMMINKIIETRKEMDSLGGIIETFVDVNNHIFGDPIFDSVEAKISSYLFSVGGLKGVSFGKGFDFASLKGSEANDSYKIENGKVVTRSNNNGGINGGITSGNPIIINSVIKPTSSIGKEQDSVNLVTKENVKLNIKGRHDPCIAPRALYVINSLVALAILDMIVEEYGKRYFMEK